MNLADIKEMISQLVKSRDLGETRWHVLKNVNGKTYALVMAWQDGFEKAENPNEYQYDTYRICGKVAYNDSSMKEYDMDWIMPYDEETGEVNDTECSLEGFEDISSAIAYWDKCWDEIKETL